MKKIFIIPVALFLTGCSLKPETPENVADYENQVPNNLGVDLDIGWTYKESGRIEIINNDVYINYQRDADDESFNNSFFAHLKDDGYEYYRKNIQNNTDWISFVPVSTDRENPNALDAVNALVGVTNSAFYDIFNVRIINGVKLNGTRHINDEPVSIYTLGDTAYYISDNINMFMQIAQTGDKDMDWSVKVKSYSTINAFTDSPTF